ncbi:MAG: hypothetical protein J0L96_12215 [Anaerolineae bacterium]|nr:hypothetical protein [Anaerolineae bacterium]
MKLDSKRQLEDFIERAEKIRKFSYLNEGENIVGFQIIGEKIDFYQPTDEQLEAVVLNLRLFLQNGDGISFRELAKLCEDPDISKYWKDEFIVIRQNLNISLDIEVVEDSNKGKLTNRDILNMFVFGKLAHKDPKDKHNELYRRWVTSDVEYKILINTFHTVVLSVLSAVFNISLISRKELQKVEGWNFPP